MLQSLSANLSLIHKVADWILVELKRAQITLGIESETETKTLNFRESDLTSEHNFPACNPTEVFSLEITTSIETNHLRIAKLAWMQTRLNQAKFLAWCYQSDGSLK